MRVKAAGTGLLPVALPRNPKVADPPAARVPFHAVLVTVAVAPLWLTVPFHSWVISCPPVNCQASDHPAIAAAPVLAIRTSPWKPPAQLPVTR